MASGVSMTNDDGFLQGDNEPAASKVVIVGALVSALIFMVIYSILYPGQDYPVLSDFETFGSLNGESGSSFLEQYSDLHHTCYDDYGGHSRVR